MADQDDAWMESVGPVPRPKVAVTIRLDESIVLWFRASGPGWQTRMNAVLAAYVAAQKGKEGEKAP